MNKKMVLSQATNNEAAKQDIFYRLLVALQEDAFSHQPADWMYDASKKEFYKTFSLWQVPHLKYSVLEKMEEDVRMSVRYDFHDELMYGTVYIPMNATCKLDSVQRILPKLKERREYLHMKWKANAKDVIANYFEVHKEEFLKYPLAFTSGFRTKRFVLWSCRNQYDKEMKEALGVLTNQVDEMLDERNFFPCFWENTEQTEVNLHLGGYVLHICRNYAPDLSDFTHDWPDVYVHFEIISSEESDWKNALDVIHYHKENDKHHKYKDFKEAMERADWQFRQNENGNREAYAYVPIIWSEYAEFIRKEAEEEFRGEIQVKGIVQRTVPYYDNDEMTCIEMVVS